MWSYATRGPQDTEIKPRLLFSLTKYPVVLVLHKFTCLLNWRRLFLQGDILLKFNLLSIILSPFFNKIIYIFCRAIKLSILNFIKELLIQIQHFKCSLNNLLNYLWRKYLINVILLFKISSIDFYKDIQRQSFVHVISEFY